MPVFEYTARTLKGELVRDKIDVPTKDDVLAHLRKNRMALVQMTQASGGPKLSLGGGIRTRDVVIFTRQFATMINSGLPLVQALDILAQQTENKMLAGVTRQVVLDVESGHTLADALRKHPKAFPDLYVNMVAAGEAGGILDTILLRLATFLEKNDAIVRKVKGAMIYPGVIISVAVIAISVLLIFVIPTFQNMFASAGIELPLPTRIVIGASHVLQHYWWAIILAVGGVIFAINRYYKTDGGKLQIDTLLLRLPVLGDLLRKSAVSRFTRTLGTLISSGVSILDGLEITARTAGNRVIHDAVMQSRSSIAGGDTISAPLQKSKVFPPMVISMIAVGEQTGGLDEMLSKIADFYDEEVDAAVSALLSLMEPIMIVVLGVIVGGMVIAMYLPIFDMVNAARRAGPAGPATPRGPSPRPVHVTTRRPVPMPPRDRPDAPRVDLPGRQLDALREVVNIASGHAATALSQLTDRRIMITVPEFAVATIDGIPRALGYGDAPVAAVAMHVLGDVTGSLVYLMPTDTARDLAAHLLQRAGSAPPGRDGTRFDALAESSLKETANIIGGAYANALAALLGGMVMLSVPSFGIAPPDHVLGEHRRRVHGDPFALCIETALEIEGAGTSCGGHLLLVADEGTIQSILAALKVT